MGGFQPVEDVTFIVQIDVSENVCCKHLLKHGKKVADN